MIASGLGAIATKANVPAMNVVNTAALVREPFSGAWQRNIQIDNAQCLLAFAAVYACVTRIAADVSKLRIKLVRYTEDLIWAEVQEQSPFWAVLRKPNKWQNRIQFLTDWVIMKLLYGNTYVLKVRDERGVVRAMYVLDSRRVRPMVTQDGDIYYQLQQDDLAGVRTSVVMPAMDIIHDRGPTLWHPLVGVSPIYACGASATQGNRIQANSAKFFENQSRPGGVLSIPGDVDEPSFLRMKAEWNESFASGNVGRTAVLTNGMKYEPFAVDAGDAQLIEQLKWTVEDVARAFGMPLYKIGAGPVPTSNNVEALQQQYYSDCLQGLIEAIELCLDEGLNLDKVPGQTLGTELDLDGLMRMDSLTQVDVLSKAVGGALMQPDEARRKLSLPPVPGGNTVYLQQQNYSLAALAKRDSLEDPFGKTPAPAPAPMPEVAPAEAGEVAAPAEDQRAAAAFIERAMADFRALQEDAQSFIRRQHEMAMQAQVATEEASAREDRATVAAEKSAEAARVASEAAASAAEALAAMRDAASVKDQPAPAVDLEQFADELLSQLEALETDHG
jgi:HK97 family phage portal protein